MEATYARLAAVATGKQANVRKIQTRLKFSLSIEKLIHSVDNSFLYFRHNSLCRHFNIHISALY